MRSYNCSGFKPAAWQMRRMLQYGLMSPRISQAAPALPNQFNPVIVYQFLTRFKIQGSGGHQGLAFLVTFAAIGKSDWPRAAIERAVGKPTRSAKNILGWYQFVVR